MKRAIALLVVAAATLLAQGAPAVAADQTTVCGRINAFSGPAPSTPGSVSIGTRAFALATSVAFYPRSGVAPPEVGAVRCVTGELDASGTFITVSSAGHPFLAPYPQCGTVTSLRAATATAEGRIEMSGIGQARQSLTIRAGVALPLEATHGHRCFVQDLTPTGDLVVIGMARSSEDFTIVPAQPRLPGTATESAADSAPTAAAGPQAAEHSPLGRRDDDADRTAGALVAVAIAAAAAGLALRRRVRVR